MDFARRRRKKFKELIVAAVGDSNWLSQKWVNKLRFSHVAIVVFSNKLKNWSTKQLKKWVNKMTRKMSQQIESKNESTKWLKNESTNWVNKLTQKWVNKMLFCCLRASDVLFYCLRTSRVLFLLFTRFARVVFVVLSTICGRKKNTWLIYAHAISNKQ